MRPNIVRDSYNDDDGDDCDGSAAPLALVIAVVYHTEIQSVSSISLGTVFPNTVKSHFSHCGLYCFPVFGALHFVNNVQ